MPNLVKLLNAANANTTGQGIKIANSKQPFTIRTSGGYALGGGAAGTKGVQIQSSVDSTNGIDGNWFMEEGQLGGPNVTEAAPAANDLIDIPNLSIIRIDKPMKWIRAVANTFTGTATVEFEATL
jgi:hypothetical protein